MIHLNNAGTSWPKPPGVLEAAARTLAEPPDAGLLETAAREISAFLGIADPSRLLFTPGCTAALDLAIRDLPWREGDRALMSGWEHHALARPLHQVRRQRGVGVAVLPGRPVDLEAAERELRKGAVRLVACTMACNVTGERLPVKELADLAHRHGALMLVDAAQAVGVLPVDVAALGADLLAFAGHKGPLGPQGVGALYAAPGVRIEGPAAACEPGGEACALTSSFPGYCDAGSANLAAIAGLLEGIRWIRDRGVDSLPTRSLAARFREGLGGRLRVHGRTATGAVSLTAGGTTPAALESRLAERGITARAGHHCAPLAHQSLGTLDGGTLRVSFGPFNTEADVEAALAALAE